jgi:hypothetical protein
MRVASHRATAAIAAVVALLVVVGAPAARRRLVRSVRAHVAPLAVVGAGIVMGAAVTIAVLRPRVRLRGGPPEGSPETGVPVRAGPLTLALAVLLPVAIVALYASLGASGRHSTAPPPPQFGTHEARQPKPQKPGSSGADGAAALAAGAAAAVVGLGALAVRRRAQRRRELPADARAAVAAGAREARAAAAIPADPAPSPPTRAWRRRSPAWDWRAAPARRRASTWDVWRPSAAAAARPPRA